MNFVHISDIHFDTPFTSLKGKNDLSKKRKIEQRNIFTQVIDFIKHKNVKYLFIAGDLFEQENVKLSTIEYLNNEFKKIPNTKIFIAPGNHDPYLMNSYYSTYKWTENVFIFKGEIECVEENEVDIYGYGFTNFYSNNSKIESINLKNKDKINVLISHGDLDGSINDEKSYNPLSYNRIKDIGFDYIALGHIHKTNFNEYKRIIYPGSLISLGFDEVGNHGMIYGEISKNNSKVEFIKLDYDYYQEYDLDISEIYDKEALIQAINNLKLNNEYVYKIKLVGIRKFYFGVDEILKYISNENILKIKDNSKSNYDFNKISNENNLRGYFIKEMIDKLNNATDEEKKQIKEAMELGLEILE